MPRARSAAERVEHASDAVVERSHHGGEDLDRTAVRRRRPVGELLFLERRLPGPVRRRVVERQIERASTVPFDEVARPVGEDMGEIPPPRRDFLAVEREIAPVLVPVAEVRRAGALQPEELVKARFQRPEARRLAAVPLAEEARPVASAREQPRQRGKFRLEPEGIAVDPVQERLGEPGRVARRVAPGQQGDARRRAGRRAGVAVGEANALGGEPVDVRGDVVGPAAAGEISPSEVVGEHEDDVGLAHGAGPGTR